MYHRSVKRFFGLPIVALALSFSLAGCYGGTRPPRIGEPAPDFVLQDGNKTVALHDFKGDIVVLNFWATWCPPCVEEIPSLEQMQKQLASKGVKVLAVSLDVDRNAYHKFIKDHGINYLTVRDPDQKSNTMYGTFKFPETYIIDRKGVIRRKFIGAVDWTYPDIESYITGLSNNSAR